MRADGGERKRVEGQHAHDLGLPVPAGMPGPRARVEGDHLVPFRLPAKRPEALEVVAVVLVGLEDLLDRRPDDEGAGAALRLDEPAELFGVDAACEHVRAGGDERGQRGHERRDVEQRSAVQVHVVGVNVGQAAVSALPRPSNCSGPS